MEGGLTSSELAGFGVGTLLLWATLSAPKLDALFSASQRSVTVNIFIVLFIYGLSQNILWTVSMFVLENNVIVVLAPSIYMYGKGAYKNTLSALRPSKIKSISVSSVRVAWVPPPDDSLKLNSDAVITEGVSYMGAGDVIRDSDGKVIAALRKIVELLLVNSSDDQHNSYGNSKGKDDGDEGDGRDEGWDSGAGCWDANAKSWDVCVGDWDVGAVGWNASATG
ncbi:hypothetical protein Ddye_001743 [Dipteronia dyeriana]|uniref:Uncharacterized protein n=1 Tax=Dipteronia dyeriana TaxID=168575 RepID=A0AAD9XP77_9ROSI|nr:hypothetical protein Ddye_001743 [Dipteronia dyeriana]